MSKRLEPLIVHSLGEAYLYARVTPCAVCAGPLDADEARFDHDAERRVVTLEATCRRCDALFERELDVTGVNAADFALLQDYRLAGPWEAPSPGLNPTTEASLAIDLAGWLAAFTLVNELARTALAPGSTSAERAAARRMRLVAGACLEEALKFYEEDNDLPSDEAFFGAEQRRQFWERPELFTRQYVADLRLALASAGTDR